MTAASSRQYVAVLPHPAVTSRAALPSDPESLLLVHLIFSPKSRFIYRVTDENSVQRVDHLSDMPLRDAHVFLNFSQLITRASEIIAEEIRAWDVPRGEHEKLIKTAMDETKRAVASMPVDHKVVDIHFRVILVREYCFDERLDLREHGRLVGADEESIMSLLETRRCVGDHRDCAVCLEELKAGCEAVRMPCSHDFHGDCIKTWLRRSRYCPLCRFKMPKTC